MDCSEIDNLLVDYLYGELPDTERAAFEQHLQSCSAHAEEVERLRAMLTLMRNDPREEPSDAVTKEILQAARASVQKTVNPLGWLAWIRTPIAAAAALVAIIGIGVVVYFNEQSKLHPTITTSEVPLPPQAPAAVAESSAAVKDEKPSDKGVLMDVPKKTPAPVMAQAPSSRKATHKEKFEERAIGGLRPEPDLSRSGPRDDVVAKSEEKGEGATLRFASPPEEYEKKSDIPKGSEMADTVRPAEAAKSVAAGAPAAMAARAKEEPSNEPVLSDSDATVIVHRHTKEFEVCSRKYSSVKGTMQVSVVIASDGAVTNVSTLTDKYKGTPYAECISSQIKKISFPKFEGEPKTVFLPFSVK